MSLRFGKRYGFPNPGTDLKAQKETVNYHVLPKLL